jgi:ADP-heptose:LPS heptosyltransferase
MYIAAQHKINIPVKKILVIQLGDIGDVVWAIPTYWALKAAFPQASLSVLVRNNYGDFLVDDNHIDKIFTVNSESVLSSLQLLRKLRREKIDLLFDLRADDRGAYTSFFSGAKIRAAMYYGRLSWRNRLFTHLVESPNVDKKTLGAAQQSLRIINGFGIKETASIPQIFVNEKVKEKISDFLSKEKVEQKNGWISMNPFSRWSYKEWGIDKWRKLSLFIWQTYKMPTIITGSIEERKRSDELVTGSNCPIHNFAGMTSLREMAALLQMSRLHIGVDSAAPHIAAAVGTPTLTIYGPSDWREWAPTGEKNMVVVSDMDCVPCRNKGCEGNNRSKCLDELPLAKVQDAAEKIFAKIIKK